MKKLLSILLIAGLFTQAQAGRNEIFGDESLYQKLCNAEIGTTLWGYTVEKVVDLKNGFVDVFLKPASEFDEPLKVNYSTKNPIFSIASNWQKNNPLKKVWDEHRSIERMDTIKKYAKIALSTVGVAAVLGGLYWAWNR
jgi:hypothetical protein